MSAAFYLNNSSVIKHRFTAFHIFGKGCFCENKVEMRKNLEIICEFFRLFADQSTQFCKNSFNLFFFFSCQFPEFIIHLNYGHGFYEKGRTGG